MFSSISRSMVAAFLMGEVLSDNLETLSLIQRGAHLISDSDSTKLSTECAASNNKVPGLVPTKGMWLGSGLSGEDDYEKHFTKHSLTVPDVHVFRMYSELDDISDWLTDYNQNLIKNHTEKGKIMWFDVKPMNFTKCAWGDCYDSWVILGDILNSIKPHNAFVSIGHEIDHEWPGVTGTNENYVTMSQNAIDMLRNDMNVTNAVFKWVVSNQIWDSDSEGAACWECALERWPGNDYVDWVGVNMYLKYAKDNNNGTAQYMYGETFFTTEKGKSVQFVLDNMTGKLTEGSRSYRNFTAKPWALSTVGVHSEDYDVSYNDTQGNGNLGVPKEFQKEFMENLNTTMNSGHYSQFKMFAYFDSDDCAISDNTVYKYHSLATSDAFTCNHKC